MDTFYSLTTTQKNTLILAMIHATLDHIGSVFGGVNKPKLGQMREVASKMGQVYPALFQDETCGGYGLGGLDRFIRQIDLMEAYLRETIPNADFYEFLEMIEQKCQNEYDGALHFKWINIIVWKLFELH